MTCCKRFLMFKVFFHTGSGAVRHGTAPCGAVPWRRVAKSCNQLVLFAQSRETRSRDQLGVSTCAGAPSWRLRWRWVRLLMAAVRRGAAVRHWRRHCHTSQFPTTTTEDCRSWEDGQRPPPTCSRPTTAACSLLSYNNDTHRDRQTVYLPKNNGGLAGCLSSWQPSTYNINKNTSKNNQAYTHS